MADRSERTNDRKHNNASPNRNKRKGRKRNKGFVIFFVITMIIGIFVCVTLFVLAYRTMVPPSIIGGPPLREDNEVIEMTGEYNEHVLGMIVAISNDEPQAITIIALESGLTDRLNVTETTNVQNRYGSNVDFREISVGQIVDIDFDAYTRNIGILSQSGRAWEQNNRSNVDIDIAASTIAIGNQVYTFSNRTLVLNRGESFSINMINPDDTLSLVGYDNKVWSIRIDTGHGFIRFINADRVVNGTVAVGSSVFTGLEGDGPVSVPEGLQRVIVEGHNIETFFIDVEVRQGETALVDLRDLVFRQGTLQLIINEPGASVFINGEAITLDYDLVELDYGTHHLRVVSHGFVTYEREIELTQLFVRIDINLERDVVLARIMIETFPAEAQIFVDGVLIGLSPTPIDVEYGNRHILAQRTGFEDWNLHLFVDEHSPRQYFLHLIEQNIPVLPPLDEDPVLPPGDNLPQDPAPEIPLDELQEDH